MAADTRTRRIVEVEISAARAAFLAADEAGDYDTADAEYQRLNALLDEYTHVPHPRPAS